MDKDIFDDIFKPTIKGQAAAGSPGAYVRKSGIQKGKVLVDIPDHSHRGFVKFCKDLLKKGEVLAETVEEDLQATEAYLKATGKPMKPPKPPEEDPVIGEQRRDREFWESEALYLATKEGITFNEALYKLLVKNMELIFKKLETETKEEVKQIYLKSLNILQKKISDLNSL